MDRRVAHETVDIEIDADGVVTVFSGTQAMGQGLETTYTQLIEEVLGVPAAKIRIVQGDTDRANGVGSVGSRSAFVGGSAVVAAGHKMVARLREIGSEALGGDFGYRAARGRCASPGRPVDLAFGAGCAPADESDSGRRDRNAVHAVVAQRRAGRRGGNRSRNRR